MREAALRPAAGQPCAQGGLQGSTTILYNVIYGGLALKIPKNIIYAERYIWRLDFSIFETVLELDRDFSPLRGENFLQILVHVVVFRSKHVSFIIS